MPNVEMLYRLSPDPMPCCSVVTVQHFNTVQCPFITSVISAQRPRLSCGEAKNGARRPSYPSPPNLQFLSSVNSQAAKLSRKLSPRGGALCACGVLFGQRSCTRPSEMPECACVAVECVCECGSLGTFISGQRRQRPEWRRSARHFDLALATTKAVARKSAHFYRRVFFTPTRV